MFYTSDMDSCTQTSNQETSLDLTSASQHQHGSGGTTSDQRQKAIDKGSMQDDTKLCGYLNKYKVGSRALLRTFKSRWFVYESNRCKLVYYRNAQDLLPLGEVDIASATFSFDAQGNSDRLGLFQISSGGKVYYLEARDKRTRMYWLQELQKRRRDFSTRKTSIASQHSQNLPDSIPRGSDTDIPQVLSPVLPTQGTVGEQAAEQGHSGFSHLSISNLKTEVLNAVANIRSNRKSALDLLSPASTPSPLASPSGDASILDPQPQRAATPREFKISTLRKKFNSSRKCQSTDTLEISSPQAAGQDKSACQRCSQLNLYVSSLKDDLETEEEELMAHREIVKLLQKQNDILQTEINTRQSFTTESSTSSTLNKVLERDRKILELEHLLASTQEEKEMVMAQLTDTKMEVQSLKDEVGVFKEMMVAKDQMIISLTNRVDSLEDRMGNHKRALSAGTNTTLRRVPDAKAIDRLKDEVDAYKLQNKFMSKELLELNQLRRNDDEREKILTVRCATLEAKFYQTHSKYLLLLNELHTPRREGDDLSTQELVSSLLQDAMESDDKPSASPVTVSLRNSEYDCYGFQRAPREDDEVVAMATNLQKRSEEITTKIQVADLNESKQVRWENFLVKNGARDLQRSPELKNLTRLGIPHEYKERVWKMCLSFWVGQKRHSSGPEYYTNLVASIQGTSKFNPAAKQIELDLLRTLPSNKHYMHLNADGIPKLRRILLAFSHHNPAIQYCQGMNRVAALALLFLPEEDSFWCLVAIIEHVLPPDYYSTTLLAAQADQRVLKELVAEKLPRLHSHLESNSLDLSLFTFNWFLTVFVDNIPPDMIIRIWDAFLYEGSKVLFRYAIAFLKYKEDELLRQADFMALNNYMRSLGEEMTDIHRISQVAFHELNPFPMKSIQTKRQFHCQQVKKELDELDAIRREFIESHPRTDQDQDYVGSDDD